MPAALICSLYDLYEAAMTINGKLVMIFHVIKPVIFYSLKFASSVRGSGTSRFLGNFRSQERKFPGTLVPGNIRSRERRFPLGIFAPRSENTGERKILIPSAGITFDH